MFQDDVDVPIMMRSLQSKLRQHRLSVALWGLRSQFKGKAFDIGMKAETTVCESSSKPETYRPFYAFIVGKSPDVRHLIEVLSNNTSVTPKENVVVFATDFGREILDWSRAKVTRQTGVSQSGSVVHGGGATDFRSFNVRSGVQQPTIALDLPYRPAPYSPAIDFSKVIPTVQARVIRSGKAESPPDAAQRLSTRLEPAGAGLARLNASFNSHGLAKGIYAYEIVLPFGPDCFELPEWCSTWSMKESEATSGPETTACVKSQNLWEFTRNLWASIVRVDEPKSTPFYLYFQVPGES